MEIKKGVFILNNKNKKGKTIKIFVVIMLVIVIIGCIYYFYLKPEKTVEVTYQTSQPEVGDIEVVLENSGVIEYLDSAEITSKINGTINNLYVGEETYVNTNSLILDIDTRSSKISLEQAQVDLYLAELNLADILNTTIENIDNVNIDDLTVITAPISGVLDYTVEVGANINDGSTAMTINDTSKLKFVAHIPERYREEVELNQEIDIIVDKGLFYLNGTVDKISNTVYSDGEEMFFDVFTTVDNPGILEGTLGTGNIKIINYYYYVDGEFENVAKSSVIPSYSGTVEEIYVESGEYVTAGTPLFKIDSTSLENQIEQQKQTIYNKELNIQELLLNMEDTTVVSDVSGVVTDLYVKEGESINNGTKIASVVSDSLVASIDIDELDIGKVELGQEAKLIIPGYSEDEEIIGTVSYIADKGNVLDGITTYEVHISFDSNEKIKEGMTVEVTIIVDSATDVVMVPSSSIKTMNNRSMVQVLENGEVTMKPVEIGISDDFYTEIVSGIDESVEVITSMESTAVPAMGDMSEEEMMEMRDQMKKSGQIPSDGGGMGGLTGGGK